MEAVEAALPLYFLNYICILCDYFHTLTYFKLLKINICFYAVFKFIASTHTHGDDSCFGYVYVQLARTPLRPRPFVHSLSGHYLLFPVRGYYLRFLFQSYRSWLFLAFDYYLLPARCSSNDHYLMHTHRLCVGFLAETFPGISPNFHVSSLGKLTRDSRDFFV